MLGSIFSGLSGLLGFSNGLEVISNNVANMNTPGFKASELAFRDLVYRYSTNGGNGGDSSSQIGTGVDTPSTRLRFKEGELRATGNDLDAAIDGNGMFVLRRDGELYYSRSGQFEVDADGYLVDRGSGAHVMALTGASALQDININSLRSSVPRATTEVLFNGNLSEGSTTHTIKDITVYDTHGSAHQLTVKFINNSAVPVSRWLVEVSDQGAANPAAVIASGEIHFQAHVPLANFNSISFAYAPGSAPATTIRLNFGEPGTYSGVSNLPGGSTSDAKLVSQNGYAAGALTKTTYDEKGNLKLTYSNGQTNTGPRLALAWFRDLQQLELTGGDMFVNNTEEKPMLYGATDEMMGKVVAGKIELSNVDLTEQFTDMVIIQRGYQASSQIVTVSNEMIQQLMDMHRRG
jgi:flagellar hook protein FlgE